MVLSGWLSKNGGTTEAALPSICRPGRTPTLIHMEPFMKTTRFAAITIAFLAASAAFSTAQAQAVAKSMKTHGFAPAQVLPLEA